MSQVQSDKSIDANRFERFAAGAELDVAIGLSRLGCEVGYRARVRDDSFGQFLLGVLDREGIARRGVAIDCERPTGFMLESRADDGADPAIEYHRRGSAASAMSVDTMPTTLDARTRHLHLTGISPAHSQSCRELVLQLARAARDAGCRVSFDPNLRPRLWRDQPTMVATLNELAAFADIVLPGLAEGRLLMGCERPQEIAQHYRSAARKRSSSSSGRMARFARIASVWRSSWQACRSTRWSTQSAPAMP